MRRESAYSRALKAKDAEISDLRAKLADAESAAVCALAALEKVRAERDRLHVGLQEARSKLNATYLGLSDQQYMDSILAARVVIEGALLLPKREPANA